MSTKLSKARERAATAIKRAWQMAAWTSRTCHQQAHHARAARLPKSRRHRDCRAATLRQRRQTAPGQTVEYVITDAEADVPNDRVRAYALWEGWFGYDRKKYAAMLREAFEPFEHPCRVTR